MHSSSMTTHIFITATRDDDNDGQLLAPPYKYRDIQQSSSSSLSLLSTISDNTTEYTSSSIGPPNYNDPPSYNDPNHPWTTDPVPQEEEEKEFLPPYRCTVSHVGKVYVKKERENPHSQSKRRPWNKLYVVLWGTQLRAYKHRPKHPKEDARPLWCHSMEGVQVGLATDYLKYPHGVRVKICEGPQFLMRCCTHRNAMLWIDMIQTSALVSTDLDARSMPVFTYDRRHRNRLALPSS